MASAKSRKGKPLAHTFIKNLKEPGKYGDGNGLYLEVTKGGTKQWLQRIMIQTKRRDVGHGSFKDVSLEEARQLAADFRKAAREGRNPIAERKRAREVPTFKALALEYHAEKTKTLKNKKHAAQWITTLETYAFPKIGETKVSHVEVSDIIDVLKPIWTAKHETADRVRQRMGVIFQRAQNVGWRSDNPAEIAKSTLPKVKKAENHHKAISYDEIGIFLKTLQASSANRKTKLAIEFLILTACRAGEVRMATWDEFDLPKAEWNIPADRMKAAKTHRVPLTKRMIEILEEAKTYSGNQQLVFPGQKHSKPMSENTYNKLVKDLGFDATAHGFRTTFRTWTQDKTEYQRDVVEAALAHQEKNKAVAAYARSDWLEKRRDLMNDWEAWCLSKSATTEQETSRLSNNVH